MSERPLVPVEQLKVDLQRLGRAAEVLRPAEAALEPDFRRTVAAMDTYLEHLDDAGFLKLSIGRLATTAMQFSANSNTGVHHVLVKPGRNFYLVFRREIPVEPFSAFPEQRVTEPVYGLTHYFNLATIGQTLDEGGDLQLSRD